jgi:hypothetical protein
MKTKFIASGKTSENEKILTFVILESCSLAQHQLYI